MLSFAFQSEQQLLIHCTEPVCALLGNAQPFARTHNLTANRADLALQGLEGRAAIKAGLMAA